MKNILVITSSARLNSNSVALTSQFIKGAIKIGHSIEIIDTTKSNFKACTACNMCWTNNLPCIYNDDTTKLYESLIKADIILFSTPLYWYNFSSNIKLLIDKLYPFIPKKYPDSLNIEKVYLFATCADASINVFEPIVKTFEHITDYLDWRIEKTLLVNKMNVQNDILNSPSFLEAYELGLNA